MSTESHLSARAPTLAEPLAWLGANAHAALPEDPGLRDWLQDSGSLTSRLRKACGTGFRLELLGEATEAVPEDASRLLQQNEARARRVRMLCGENLCVCATTLIPANALAANPWLAELGDRPLGDALLERGGIQRSPFEFARVSTAHPLFAPSLEAPDIRPSRIWARRSCFSLAPGALLIYEMFFPGLTRCGTP